MKDAPRTITHASLFSGIGAAELAARWMGWENMFHCEIDGFCRRILQYHFPEETSYEDIKQTDFTPWRDRIGVLTGGFPCQPFSFAGRREGTRDDRYLWPDFVRVVQEVRPAWVVGENVAGILTMVQPGTVIPLGSEAPLFGKDFYEEEIRESFVVETVCRDLEKEGYSVQPVVIPACAVGAPHRRDRVFFIAHRNGDGFGHRAGEPKPQPGCQAPSDLGSAVQDGTPTYSLRLGGHKVDDQVQPLLAHGAGTDRDVRKRASADTCRIGRQTCELHGGKDHPGAWPKENGRKSRPTNSPQEFWHGFPHAQPAVRRGDDGIPFNVDSLAISYARWRRESVRAYGNAIVPQVMYEIFLTIKVAEDTVK